MWLSRIFIVVLYFVVTSVVQAEVYYIGKFGATYSIKERDALDEIMERASKVDYFSLAKNVALRLKDYRPKDLISLPDANEQVSRLVDPTYTLDFDIYDDRGNILYPKGYTFNPLDIIGLTNTYVFINGGKSSHVEWFNNSEYAKRVDVTLLITEGSYYDVIKRLKRPVYYATALILNRLNITHLPSVVRQKGRYLEVSEYPVDRKDKKKEEYEKK